MTIEQRMQRILEEQGHIIIWSDGERTIGQVIETLDLGALKKKFPHAVVVIGTATIEEHHAQSDRYGFGYAEALPGFHFYKVTAE